MTASEPIATALRDLAVSDPVRERLQRYAAALLARNATTNLTAARSPDAVAEHVRDSLALAPFVREPLIDIGSGGGFPGIPLAIATGFRLVLVESVAKKAAFLTAIVAELELSVTVVCGRAEDLGRDAAYRARFASATARAVAGVTTVLELTVPLLEIGGVALLQRGTYDAAERIAAADAALVLGVTLEAEIPTPGPPDERRLLIARKTDATSPRFPRRAGIPAKRPLCLGGVR
ncbi:MAG: 16S rRNA (guanine(527)-N(7))-methyltransferase RsmG [Vulcanimicrobiaceae bacterium]